MKHAKPSNRKVPFLPWRADFGSIQSQIMLSFAAVLLPLLLLVSWVVYTESARSSTQTTAQYSRQITQQVSHNIEQYINSMDNLASTLYWDPDVRRFLELLPRAAQKQTETGFDRIQNWLTNVLKIRPDIRGIYVFSHDGYVLAPPGGNELKPWVHYPGQSWYREAVKARGQPVVSSSHAQNLFLNQYPWVVSLSRAVLDEQTGRTAGVVLIELNFQVIDDICSKITLGARGYVFIVDQSGRIVYHPQQQLVYSGVKTEDFRRILHVADSTFTEKGPGEDRLVTVYTSKPTGWRIIGMGYTRDLFAPIVRLRNTLILVCLAALAAGLGVSIFLASRIAKPIRHLESSMQRLEAGELGITVPVTARYEIVNLEHAFNMMSERIKDLLHQTHCEQEAKRKSELRALQAQINPHFLYNTLDSVVWMAESGRMRDVVTMISALAKLFRRALSGGRDLIPLADEIEHVENYLIIQNARFADSFDYAMHLPSELSQVLTLKLVLQPLVENAILHGLRYIADRGHVEIRAYRMGQDLVIEVEDNGVGIPPKILASWRQRPTEAKNGVGLINVEERIKLFFGPQYGLTVESEPDRGTKVIIRQPLWQSDQVQKER